MKSSLHLYIGLAFVSFFAACVGVDPAEQDTESENESSTEQGIESGWTDYTSEEYAPIICDRGSMISAVECSGWYCDKIRVHCSPTDNDLGSSSWTSYFSDEGSEEESRRMCDDGYWMTGLTCKGWYCDDISLQCSYISNTTAQNCYWTGWISEEDGGLLEFGSGYYARGAQCDGWYCDNKRFYVCQR